MKLSETPTNYLIVYAKTNSEWDECDFAIIHVNETWRKELQNRLVMMQALEKDFNLLSMDYYDTSVQFYKDDNEVMTDSLALMNEKKWSFLSMSEEELNALSPPENRLDCTELAIKRGGYAIYRCFGKYTSEEFWTADLPISEIVQLITANNSLNT